MTEIATRTSMPWKVKATVLAFSPLVIIGVAIGAVVGNVKFGMSLWDRFIHWTFE